MRKSTKFKSKSPSNKFSTRVYGNVHKRVFRAINIINFWIGVNVIGLPEIYSIKIAMYKNELTY